MSDNTKAVATQDFDSVLDKVYDTLEVTQQNNAEYRQQLDELQHELGKAQAESQRLYQILHGIWEAYQPSITFENWLEIAGNHPDELLTLQNDSPQSD